MADISKVRIVTEFAGALSIVLSLIFVGIELRHANNLAETEAVQSINQMIAGKLNGDLQNAWGIRASGAANNLSIQDEVDFLERIQWLNIYEAAWKSYDRGIIDAEQAASYLNGACYSIFVGINIDEYTWGERSWEEYSEDFNPGYVAELEGLCIDVFQ